MKKISAFIFLVAAALSASATTFIGSGTVKKLYSLDRITYGGSA